MKLLKTKPNIIDPDRIYQKLIELHEHKSDAESMRINAKLVLLLANHIGDMEVLEAAIGIAGKKNKVRNAYET